MGIMKQPYFSAQALSLMGSLSSGSSVSKDAVIDDVVIGDVVTGIQSNALELDPRWIKLLAEEVARTNITQAARKIGYARPSVSLALKGRYPGGTDRIAAAVLRHLDRKVFCPFYHRDLSLSGCYGEQAKPLSTSNPRALRLWRTCQACDHCQDGHRGQNGNKGQNEVRDRNENSEAKSPMDRGQSDALP
ncbi:hypothetical protein [Kiloniella majae]|uniref:hypothetical protein n=1 Tax=Kiloniella majae TaxID=1938558 RepID=UPI0015C51EED|nr:hypothetical protein [Kiloniella majae]